MGMFLNSFIPYEAYRDIKAGRFFVDKTRLIGEVLKMVVEDRQKYICITRPRRFGKSVMTHMLGAYLGRYADAGEIFDDLAIAGTDLYREHLNKYNVIYIDLSKIPENCRTYQAYQDRISEGIRKDLLKAYAGAVEDADRSVWDILSDVYRQTGEKFVFIMNEWDAVFHMPFITEEEQKEYLLFLKNLLKDQVYTGLAYMTGILPIAKYSDGSELNMFLEYSMTAKVRFGEYFGFSDAEVDALFKKYQEMTPDPRITREDKAGKGYVDFIFYPECKSEDAIILELKTDHTPEEAIRQIREKAYALQFRGRLGEKTKYTGRVLAVGISYSRKTKQHSCRVEVLAQDETEEKYSVRG